MLNNYKINLLDISLIFLSISLCLWSTTWNFLDLIRSSYLLYISIFLISVVIILTNFNLRKIDNTVFFFLTFFLLINFIYYLFGLFEYFLKNQDISYINQYYLKQNISIIFSLLFYKFIFNEKNIDKFIQYSIVSYFVIFLVLIYFYLYVFKADFIGVHIDLEVGKTRVNKNTFGTFLNLLFPFLITYIFKKKKYLSGPIFIFLYLIIIFKIDSSASLIIFLFQIILYLIMYFKKLLLTFFFICFFLFSIFLFLNPIENESNLDDSFLSKQIEDVNNYMSFNSHRGSLLDSGLQKIKKDFFLGSGIETFRIRDDYKGSRTETHNAYLNITVSYGLPGLFLYLFFYYFLFKKIYKKNNMNISNYDGACIVYIFTLIVILNAVNIEYSTSIWILNSICLSRAYSKK
tara:strand:- start:3118 stop:4329 length:1212 start_codon:yes stop_codon:yes gene_type:complete